VIVRLRECKGPTESRLNEILVLKGQERLLEGRFEERSETTDLIWLVTTELTEELSELQEQPQWEEEPLLRKP
jgi:hypothetical protein